MISRALNDIKLALWFAKVVNSLSKFKLIPKKVAFTLAEVLIVLGVIGIVAEMTIPTLMNNVQDAVLKTSFKKAYSVASQAWLEAVADTPDTYTGKGAWGCNWTDGTSGDYNAGDLRSEAFKAKMKVLKSCVAQTGCWPDSYEYYAILGNGTAIGSYSPYDYSWVTADGMCWAAPWHAVDDVHIVVDTNCNKKPNKVGQDIFSMLLGADGHVYFAIDDTSTNGKPVSSGWVCPYTTDPTTINGRTVSFRNLLMN